MTASARAGNASLLVSGLLVLGAADLMFLNLWVFPRTIRGDAQQWLTAALRPPAPPPEAVNLARAPQPVEIAPLLAAAPPAASPPAEAAPAEAPAPAQETPPPVAPAPATGRSVRILFAYNQYGLTADAVEALGGFAALRNDAGARLRIDGHADSFGPASYNLWISEQRARVVAYRMASLGWPRERIQLTAHGDTRPVAPGRDVATRRRNRRVEIAVIYAGNGGNAHER
jgi:outer membrane protein OmpA-like peptidoglycan-associated protein